MAPPLPKSGPVTLQANIMEYVNTKALRSGEVASDLVKIEFTGPKIANQGFKPLIREAKFHTSELAVVSFLQAREAGKPLVMAPAPILSRFQHHCISYNTQRCPGLTPKGLEGKLVGLRSYSQTTALWVRAILKHEYGVDLNSIRWSSYDPPHPAEIKDPDFVIPFEPKGTVEEMLADGAFDAAIVGTEIKGDPRVASLIPDPHTAALDWYKRKKIVPVNHYLVFGADLVEERPDVVREVYRMVGESKKANPLTSGGVDLLPMGFEANRPTIEAIIGYALEQGLIKTRFTVEELFDPVTMKL